MTTGPQRICVAGLWHLGCVTAAGLAEAGFTVTGVEENPEALAKLAQGQAPLFEPGLDDLLHKHLASGRLSFTGDFASAAKAADVVWFTYDTPVNEQDEADTAWVENNLKRLLPTVRAQALVAISSQVPAGFTRVLETWFAQRFPDRKPDFFYVPENLRLGKALATFSSPDRIVIGHSRPEQRARWEPFFARLSEHLEWMRLESAEMTKHGLNAFLATSISFANELAALCESVGADMEEVTQGLKTDQRIGPKAYLQAGAAFSGGTLARDVRFLINLGEAGNQESLLLPAVLASNERHKQWVQKKCRALWGEARDVTLAVWGLTYKPNTSTLRRSLAVELCCWLVEQGYRVRAYDPYIARWPEPGEQRIELKATLADTLPGAAGVVIATEHAEIKKSAASWQAALAGKVVIDPNGFLREQLAGRPDVRYFCVGRPG